MMIYDPLYGAFPLPSFLEGLAETPEVRRLSEIRLLNTISPALATLGEIRRYSHTLGVLYLTQLPALRLFSEEERRAFAATALLHDIGTAPFAHLFEYHLREVSGWDHESEIRKILTGTHAPENTAHQIFYGRTIGVAKALERARICRDIVLSMVEGWHPLSRLLFGSLDLDNLDNVARMAWALGMTNLHATTCALASQIAIRHSDNMLVLPAEMKPHVEMWATARRSIYRILVFNPPTVAAQAILSAAIRIALSDETLCADDWALTDEQLLGRLSQCISTKDMICNEYFGSLPQLVFAIQIPGTLVGIGLRNREAACYAIEQALSAEYRGCRPLGYVFEDRGSFEKELVFCDPLSGNNWTVGSSSQSVILYGFIRAKRPSTSHERTTRAIYVLADHLGVSREDLLSWKIEDAGRSDHEQRTFNFAP